MKEQKKRKRRAYLDSFQKDSSGTYVYKGDVYVFEDRKEEFRKELAKLWAFGLVMLMLLAAAGCVDAPGAGGCFYVLIPYVGNVIAGISVCWGLGRLTAGGVSLREYVYKETILQIPGRAVFTAVCAGMSMLGEVVYIFRNGTEGKTGGCMLFFIMEGFVLVLALAVRRQILGLKWRKNRV